MMASQTNDQGHNTRANPHTRQPADALAPRKGQVSIVRGAIATVRAIRIRTMERIGA
jgi:hypothetical protein